MEQPTAEDLLSFAGEVLGAPAVTDIGLVRHRPGDLCDV
jgi:hypothetical protein